ncbi:MAG: calcium/proton exchanger [Leptolyngbya sp. IPPAS B-1204]|uniref:Ca(2+)/H(+) antiporter n=1 Tax=Leptolyngbya sp. NK1-12 TaxID=2547451 RepID=A0AA96WCK4_9CYAN|nr:calcium/proton exchanger [Leptolyngbya sp. NK1-12]MBF2046731.1 calcium/proton exchanger [Elainella sp. C42_A2020_010]RNJ65380.1 MAG: calcium/proton exchanger [Leptolyngbya sp. IPPAS B-1204]WNZ22603.1 calcium/proton exchanger [Leptolyngbya sp. NK1-12]
MSIKKLLSIGLLIFIPISIAAERLEWGALTVFITAAIAIVPLAIWLSTATEEVAVITGPSVGGLLNAVFGNATELIIALAALRAGLVDIVKASITGTVVSNLLLVMGLSMFLGGLRYKEQEFQPVVARVNGSTMTLAVTAIVLPALVVSTSGGVNEPEIAQLSRAAAIILMVVYALTLVFSLKTHSYLYDVGVVELEEEAAAEEDHKPNLWLWLGVLIVSTVAVAYESEIFVGAVEEATKGLGLSPLFTGVILLPLVGGAAEYVTAVSVALKNNMDLSVSVAMGSSLLVALFVAPLLVLIGQALGQPMDLNFNLFEVVAVTAAVALANLISLDGRSNWLEGALLLATYAVLGAAFYFHPA